MEEPPTLADYHSISSDEAEHTAQVPGCLFKRGSFWIVAAMLVVLIVLHYADPILLIIPERWLPDSGHHAERILFLLPIASAAFAYGYAGGILTLVISVLILAPGAVIDSGNSLDASIEVAAIAFVGWLMTWIIQVQEREKRLRQEAVQRLRALHDVTAAINETLALEPVMISALDKLLELTRAETACMVILDAETGKESLSLCRRKPAARGNLPAAALPPETAGQLAEIGREMAEKALQSGQMVLALRQGSTLQPVPESADGWSTMALPIRSRDRLLGAIYLADEASNRFKQGDLELLNAICNEVGVAIENAQLHQNVERQLQNEQYLNSVSEKLTSELDLERILPTVLKIAQNLVRADGGAIALLDREDERMVFTYLENLPAELQGTSIALNVGLTGAVIAGGKPILVDKYPEYPQALESFVAAGIVSIVGVPLIRGGQSYGVLLLTSLQRVKSFSERDIAFLEAIGRQAAIAIENAYLYTNMRFYVQQVTRAQENERRRIARELHDDTIQNLIVLSRRTWELARDTGLDGETSDQVLGVQAALDQMIVNCRNFSQDLRPSILDDLGLVPALRGLVTQLTKQSGITADFRVHGELGRLPPEHELTLYRIGQEALSNVKRHSGATHVKLNIRFLEEETSLELLDNGAGFRVPNLTSNLAAAGKLGLIGMMERARLLGGDLRVESEPGEGTCVTVSVPVGATSLL